jgi:hypothetical protein
MLSIARVDGIAMVSDCQDCEGRSTRWITMDRLTCSPGNKCEEEGFKKRLAVTKLDSQALDIELRSACMIDWRIADLLT